jgi:ABC-type xylose transport system permease subunit
MILICCGIVPMLIAVSSFFGLVLPVTLLGILLIIYFFVLNKKELDRLVNKYV